MAIISPFVAFAFQTFYHFNRMLDFIWRRILECTRDETRRDETPHWLLCAGHLASSQLSWNF